MRFCTSSTGVICTLPDVEEKKEALMRQVDYLLEQKDIDEDLAREVKTLLRPRKEKA